MKNRLITEYKSQKHVKPYNFIVTCVWLVIFILSACSSRMVFRTTFCFISNIACGVIQINASNVPLHSARALFIHVNYLPCFSFFFFFFLIGNLQTVVSKKNIKVNRVKSRGQGIFIYFLVSSGGDDVLEHRIYVVLKRFFPPFLFFFPFLPACFLLQRQQEAAALDQSRGWSL